MRITLRFAVSALLAIIPFLGSSSIAQDAGSALAAAASVVKPHPYVSIEPVPRGQAFEVAIVVDIAAGYHMNSHKPSDEYLIPTTLVAQLPVGFRTIDAIYPQGHLQKFAFSPSKPLSVYSGSVTLKLKLEALPDAPLGPLSIPVTLRYQACNEASCLPPVKVPVNVKLEVASAETKPHPVHPELFGHT